MYNRTNTSVHTNVQQNQPICSHKCTTEPTHLFTQMYNRTNTSVHTNVQQNQPICAHKCTTEPTHLFTQMYKRTNPSVHTYEQKQLSLSTPKYLFSCSFDGNILLYQHRCLQLHPTKEKSWEDILGCLGWFMSEHTKYFMSEYTKCFMSDHTECISGTDLLDNCTGRHTENEDADQICYLTLSQHTVSR